MSLMQSIEEQGDFSLGLKSLFFQRIVQEMFHESSVRKDEIHVSDLVYDCLRRTYLRKKIPIPLMDYQSILRVWIGRQVHLFPILEYHELALEWKGIKCRIDEYEDGFLLDKKTTRNIPKQVRPHHELQLDYYRAVADANGYPVIIAAIAYINVGSGIDIEIKPVKFDREVEVVKEEILRKKEKFQESLDSKSLPKRQIGWLCQYCNYCNLCFLKDTVIEKIVEKEVL